METSSSLNLFHPLIRKWFFDTFGRPTDIQQKAWDVIAGGGHVLITAPTGSGKTLAAFLWSLDRLIRRLWKTNTISVLYISPLKALNADVQRNLLTPLEELSIYFKKAGEDFPFPRIASRSGDTPGRERLRMLKDPPDILITTPESLNLMLSSPRARGLFRSLRTVIMDEVHAISPQKRGTHMITAVERLARLSGEFQRIALSATVKPLDTMASFIGGYRLSREKSRAVYTRRVVAIVDSQEKKKYDITVDFPHDAHEHLADGSWWPSLIRIFRDRIKTNRSTLLFTNTRRHAEKVTRMLNETEDDILAYAHHGSLSKEIRSVVEEKLKAGELRAIVSTSSLELGIDIGTLDEVLLVETPPSVSSGLQRIGRAGHRVHDVTRGVIYPIHGRDFCEAAVMARCILDGNIEESRPVSCPLDVLAQVIISMSCMEKWDRDELYDFIRTSFSYHTLQRSHYDIVIDMLSGKYRDTRIRELSPRIVTDALDNTITGKKSSLFLLYSSGGTIADRGYFDLRMSGSGMKIGDLDEEFVWERRVGDVFTMGTQTWKITGIDQQKVEVTPFGNTPKSLPFWKAEQRHRDYHFSRQLGMFLEEWDRRVEDPDCEAALGKEYHMSPPAAAQLVQFLKRQKESTAASLPHRRHIVVEHCLDAEGGAEVNRIFIHTVWGGKVNLPFALALSSAWENKYHYPLEIFVDNICVMLLLPHDFGFRDIIELLRPDSVERLLRTKLESTGFFGALFRENAGRSLLLPRQGFGKRLPLWLTRLRSKKLFDAVLRYRDFPVLIETWRTCMQDEFDLPRLRGLLEELSDGTIGHTEIRTSAPSPLASGLVWRQTDKHMYSDDTPGPGKRSRLEDNLLRGVYESTGLRPALPKGVIAGFTAKAQRTSPGYAPADGPGLLQWIKERLLIPKDEWEDLLRAIRTDRRTDEASLLSGIKDKILTVRLPGAEIEAVTAYESLPRILSALAVPVERAVLASAAEDPQFSVKKAASRLRRLVLMMGKPEEEYPDDGPYREAPAGLIGEWLRYYGPVEPDFIRRVFGLDEERLHPALSALSETGTVIIDNLTSGGGEAEVCDGENLELLLRLARKRRRPSFTSLPARFLPLFYATWQNLGSGTGDPELLKIVLEQLFGYPAPAGLWETEIFPSRLPGYSTGWLDALLASSGLTWFGCGRGRIGFAFPEDIELFTGPQPGPDPDGHTPLPFQTDASGTYRFWELADLTGLDSAALTSLLWERVWKGELSNDSFGVIRKGILSGFRAERLSGENRTSLPAGRKRFRNPGYSRWKSSRPGEGAWFSLPSPREQDDIISDIELRKDRIRQLLCRYGILFRRLLQHELPVCRWPDLFGTLNLMELSGEITGGLFFDGIDGPHFASTEALRLLSDGLDEKRFFWLNASDPVSLCGAGMKPIFAGTPARQASTHIVYEGTAPLLVSRQRGKELEFMVPPGSSGTQRCAGFFSAMLSRSVTPWKSVRVESINGVNPTDSPYASDLGEYGFAGDYKRLVLRGGI
ncbi:MAG: DEAD/DEAH box helicase [Spirochaetales bacterium]|nr:DEAD/DEAH box helicase [Spirochaetales bacterium]